MIQKMKHVNAVTAAIALFVMTAMVLSVGSARAGYVTIDDPGNDNDTTDYGGVDYTYQIAETEVSDDDWETVMNNSSGTSDPKTRFGGLYGAMDYANALTEDEHGSSDYNVYNLSTDGDGNFTGYSIDYSRSQALSDGNRVYVIPTEDEWYKAAYYSLEDDQYYDYAHGSNNTPTEATSADNTGWNYNESFDGIWPVGSSALEENGTYDMMGLVRDYVEDDAGVGRGGAYDRTAEQISSSFRNTDISPQKSYSRSGFRVAAVPEPSSLLLLGLASLLLMKRRRV